MDGEGENKLSSQLDRSTSGPSSFMACFYTVLDIKLNLISAAVGEA